MSFFQSLRRAVGVESSAKEEEEKAVLLDSFNTAVKNFIRENRDVDASISRHNSQALEICSAIEDVLCHGLRQHGLAANPPEFPRLWDVLLTITHADTVQNLEELPFETVDAKCRAWIRVALNEGLVSNYIRSLLDASHSGLLSTNYGVGAFIRDPGNEKPELMCTMFRAVEPYKFNMSLGELCTAPPAISPADSPGRGLLFSPERPVAEDWSDVAAVKVAIPPADPEVSPAVVSPDVLASQKVTTPKKERKAASVSTPKQKRKKKSKSGHNRVRSISDTTSTGEWADDKERSGSAVNSPDMLGILESTVTSASPDVDADEHASPPSDAKDVTQPTASPVPEAVPQDTVGESPQTESSVSAGSAAASANDAPIRTPSPTRTSSNPAQTKGAPAPLMSPSPASFRPGINDPMAAPLSPTFRPGIWDPMAPVNDPAVGRPRSNTGSMDWMIRQAEREALAAKNKPIASPGPKTDSQTASPKPADNSSPQDTPLSKSKDEHPPSTNALSSQDSSHPTSTEEDVPSAVPSADIASATAVPVAAEATAQAEIHAEVEEADAQPAHSEENRMGEPEELNPTISNAEADVESGEALAAPDDDEPTGPQQEGPSAIGPNQSSEEALSVDATAFPDPVDEPSTNADQTPKKTPANTAADEDSDDETW